MANFSQTHTHRQIKSVYSHVCVLVCVWSCNWSESLAESRQLSQRTQRECLDCKRSASCMYTARHDAPHFLSPHRCEGEHRYVHLQVYCTVYLCVCVSVWMCGCERVGRGDVPCSSALGSHDSPGWHIHLCLFAKFDFKYLSRHTSWLKQIAGKVLLSVKHVVRRMEALEGTSMFHLAKYMTEEVYVQPQHFSTQEGDNGGKNFLKCIRGRRASVWRSQSRSL